MASPRIEWFIRTMTLRRIIGYFKHCEAEYQVRTLLINQNPPQGVLRDGISYRKRGMGISFPKTMTNPSI